MESMAVFGRKRRACPRCGEERMSMRYVPGVGGTRIVPGDEPGWSKLETGDPAAYVCGKCEWEAPTEEPFLKAGEELTRKEEAERTRRRDDARAAAEAEMAAIADSLAGRTIVRAEFHAEDPPPGFSEASASIEGATITLDDGSKLALRAFGWHDIQSLDVQMT